MDVNDLTIGEAKELASLFSNVSSGTPSLGNSLIGKYVIVRTRNEGINAGVIKKLDDTGIILEEARRIWYHRPADKATAWYEGVAISGLAYGCKISVEVPLKMITEDYSVTVCTDVAEKSIREYISHAQN